MKMRATSICIVCLFVVGGLVGLVNFGSEHAQGTDVSGIVYDGSGGPWTMAGSPYIVVGDVTVPAGETLTIEPGVEVKFDGYYGIDVEGTLIAIGTETDKIIITSNMATPMPGDWYSIQIQGHAEIEYCDISYGFMAIAISSSNNDIMDSNIYLNDLYGIAVIVATNNNFSGNHISNNNKHGIFLNVSSSNNITNNVIFSNYRHGICLGIGNNNLITGNNVSNNGNGIYLSYYALNNKIYHNNIINNTNQAYDDTSNGNLWDDGYPSGGNYWSDFDEPSEGAYDDYNGPDQNILGSDGIVDNGIGAGGGKNPYMIDSDSQDNYPLMRPFDPEPDAPNTNSILLCEGWNLISISLIQTNTNVESVLSSITGSYDAVQWYNAGDNSDHWENYHSSKPSYMNDLDGLDHTMGFWVHVTVPGGVLFQYSGTQPTENQCITLYPGWNLVGYPSAANKIRTNALNNIIFGTDVDSIWTYDATTQSWEEVGESDYFEGGKGYWVHSLVVKTWTVPMD